MGARSIQTRPLNSQFPTRHIFINRFTVKWLQLVKTHAHSQRFSIFKPHFFSQFAVGHFACSRLYAYRFFLSVVLRLRLALIRASRVLPSTPPLSQSVERHFFEGQFGGFPVSGIHRCPQTSQTATRIVFHPMQPLYSILP